MHPPLFDTSSLSYMTVVSRCVLDKLRIPRQYKYAPRMSKQRFPLEWLLGVQLWLPVDHTHKLPIPIADSIVNICIDRSEIMYLCGCWIYSTCVHDDGIGSIIDAG